MAIEVVLPRLNSYHFLKEEHGEKIIEQFERMIKQDMRGTRLSNIINKGKGTDPIGDDIEIPYLSPFILPLPKEQIFDLVFGHKLMLFCLERVLKLNLISQLG